VEGVQVVAHAAREQHRHLLSMPVRVMTIAELARSCNPAYEVEEGIGWVQGCNPQSGVWARTTCTINGSDFGQLCIGNKEMKILKSVVVILGKLLQVYQLH